jgi:hypothetical protein
VAAVSREVMARGVLAVTMAISALALSAPAPVSAVAVPPAEEVVETVDAGTPVSAYGGLVVWSRLDRNRGGTSCGRGGRARS